MRALVIPVSGTPELRDIDNSLETLQSLVGGYIECDCLTDEIVAIVNEEGMLLNLDHNKNFPARWYHGNIVIVRAQIGAEDFDSLTLEDLTTLVTQFGVGLHEVPNE